MAFVSPLLATKFTSRPSQISPRRENRPHAIAPRMCAPAVPDVLANILARKKPEVEKLKATLAEAGPDHPINKALSARPQRAKRFFKALDLPEGSLTVIAEVKRRSPSKGQIGEIKDAGILSRIYHEGGAGAISVLTDLEGFGGTMEDLEKVVGVQEKFKGNYPGPCPVLRKDFIIDEVQIAEAAAAGASAVLLIVAALGKDRIKELLDATHEMGLDALVEVHDEAELKIALEAGAEIVGVNNRDLRTFDVSLDTSFKLAKLIPDDVVKIAESGVVDTKDAWMLRDAGFSAVLVGETLVRAFENSVSDSTSYTIGYNQAKGFIKAFKAKGSVEFGNVSAAAFFGKGEGATESLGEMAM